jgi:hypothetical protein
VALVLRRIVCHRTRDAVLQVNSLAIPLALPLGCHFAMLVGRSKTGPCVALAKVRSVEIHQRQAPAGCSTDDQGRTCLVRRSAALFPRCHSFHEDGGLGPYHQHQRCHRPQRGGPVTSSAVKFAVDSLLEGDGFELPVPGRIYAAAMRSPRVRGSRARLVGSSSQWTPCWREMDSNFRFRAISDGGPWSATRSLFKIIQVHPALIPSR